MRSTSLRHVAASFRSAGLVLLACLCTAAFAQGAGKSAIRLNAIPLPLTGQHLDKFDAPGNELILSATKSTDLFNDAGSGQNTDNAPRMLFQPKGDFIFSARISGNFSKDYDGGALIVYRNGTSWAKLLLERIHTGEVALTSTVAKGQTDDVYHHVSKGPYAYLKIARKKNIYVFYGSPDGFQWNLLRSFQLDKPQEYKVGFLSQSPVGDRFIAQFTQIKFAEKSFTDYWKGE